ncbi:MAG: efflux RND transporter periplasmic adaptor subunit, partial [Acidobacteriota bacterium]
VLALLCPAGGALAEEPPASPVLYTEARERSVQGMVRLPGSVESRTVSLVASEVEGLVESLPAREGDRVHRGDPLATLRTTSLELRLRASRAELKEAESRMKLAEANLVRARELHGEQVLSQQELDDARYEFDAWRGRVERLEAEIQQIENDLDRSTIRAPFHGTVVSERTEVGEWIAVGGPVVEMVSLDVLEIRIEVPERYFARLTPGSRTEVSFEALPDYTARGRVSAIIPRADPQARTFPVKVRIENRDGRIGVGMLAQVELPLGESFRATIVPKDAVVREGPNQFVYLLNGDGSVERVPVRTGTGVGAWITVRGAVRAGQKVITRGNERLRPGQTVRGEPLEYSLP